MGRGLVAWGREPAGCCESASAGDFLIGRQRGPPIARRLDADAAVPPPRTASGSTRTPVPQHPWRPRHLWWSGPVLGRHDPATTRRPRSAQAHASSVLRRRPSRHHPNRVAPVWAEDFDRRAGPQGVLLRPAHVDERARSGSPPPGGDPLAAHPLAQETRSCGLRGPGSCPCCPSRRPYTHRRERRTPLTRVHRVPLSGAVPARSAGEVMRYARAVQPRAPALRPRPRPRASRRVKRPCRRRFRS